MSATHVCGTCNKLFSSKYTLAAHVRGKHERKALPCTACDYTTAKPSDIERHITTCRYVVLKNELEKLYTVIAEKDEEIGRLLKQIDTLTSFSSCTHPVRTMPVLLDTSPESSDTDDPFESETVPSADDPSSEDQASSVAISEHS